MRLLTLVLVLCGCGSSISAADYAQNCAVDDDCAAVSEGDTCDIARCSCGNAAVNVAERDRYNADLAGRPCLVPDTSCIECLCRLAEPLCVDGACALAGL